MGTLKAKVIKEANAFAASKGKVAIPIAAQESPAWPGHLPSFEYQFQLVDKDDPRASGGALIPRADVVIEKNENVKADIRTKDTTTKSPDVYTELTKWDDLRTKSILTEEEFQAQKKKLLEASK